MQLNIKIPEILEERCLTSYCSRHSYELVTADSDGRLVPQTKQEFLEKKIFDLLITELKNYETEEAEKTAMKAAEEAREATINEINSLLG